MKNYSFILIVCLLTHLVFHSSAMAQIENAAFPAGFPVGAWENLVNAERINVNADVDTLNNDPSNEYKLNADLKLLSCIVNRDDASQNQIKYILTMSLTDDVPTHSCVHLLDANGVSITRIPKNYEPKANDILIPGYRNIDSCDLNTANNASKILLLQSLTGVKEGIYKKPNHYILLHLNAVGDLQLLFKYGAVGSKKWITADAVEHEGSIYWRTKIVWKNVDGQAGKEMIIRRLVIVVDNKNNEIAEKYLEDLVLAWDNAKQQFANVTPTLGEDIHSVILQSINEAANDDVFIADGPGINYEARDDFQNLDIEIKIAHGDLPVNP